MRRFAAGLAFVVVVVGLAGIHPSAAGPACQGIYPTLQVCVVDVPGGIGPQVTIEGGQTSLIAYCRDATYRAVYQIHTPVLNLGGSGVDLIPETTLPIACPF